MTQANEEQFLDAISEVVPAILNTLATFEQVQSNLRPDAYNELAALLAPCAEALRPKLELLESLACTDNAAAVQEILIKGANYALQACENFTIGATQADGFGQIMRAMRSNTRSQEAIYPLAPVMTPVSRFFLEPPLRADTHLLDALRQPPGDAQNGIIHADNSRDSRGGFSLYIPENLDHNTPVPLVVALHGGSGHGSDFIWTWLKEARSRGFILLSPTSQQGTWSLMGPDHDAGPISKMVDYVVNTWSIDERQVLLTGMSDGATYSLLCGLQKNTPFTHLACLSGVLHPDNFMNGNMSRARDKPIYLVHGSLDWMFPIERAYMARDELLKAGAALEFREIADLSHNYAREENNAILNWFCPALTLEKNSTAKYNRD